MGRYLVSENHEVEAGSPEDAVRVYLRDVFTRGKPVVFQVREFGGMGGAQRQVLVVDAESFLEGWGITPPESLKKSP